MAWMGNGVGSISQVGFSSDRGASGRPALPPSQRLAVHIIGARLQTQPIDPPTWNMLAPYGVLHAFNRLSFPVLTNHLPADGEKQGRMRPGAQSNKPWRQGTRE